MHIIVPVSESRHQLELDCEAWSQILKKFQKIYDWAYFSFTSCIASILFQQYCILWWGNLRGTSKNWNQHKSEPFLYEDHPPIFLLLDASYLSCWTSSSPSFMRQMGTLSKLVRTYWTSYHGLVSASYLIFIRPSFGFGYQSQFLKSTEHSAIFDLENCKRLKNASSFFFVCAFSFRFKFTWILNQANLILFLRQLS